MGSVIRKDAAVPDIVEDVGDALTNARAKGGDAKELAEKHLAPVHTLLISIAAQLKDAQDIAKPLVAAMNAENKTADDLLGEVSDIVWNAVGRPAPGSDPALAVIFPGGIAYYAEGDVEGQPDRMEVLSQLLTAGMHPKLAADKAKEVAKRVMDAAEALRAKVEAARKPLAKLGVLERIYTSVARVGQIQLTNLKRVLKAAGFSEADVHTIIPDRPARAKPEPKSPPEGGGSPPG
jgi:hypothetical protein